MRVPSRNYLFVLIWLLSVSTGCNPQSSDLQSSWSAEVNRTWIGPDFWANRLQDWHLRDGRIETTSQAADKPLRTLHLLTRRLGPRQEAFSMKVSAGWIDPASISDDASVGFLVGAGGELDYRAAALIHHSPGPGMGIVAGINSLGQLVFKDLNGTEDSGITGKQLGDLSEGIELTLVGSPEETGYSLILRAESIASRESEFLTFYTTGALSGNVALTTSFDRAWFTDWDVEGDKFDLFPDRNAGPVLGTQYTLSERVLKMTAQMMPMGQDDPQSVRLETQTGGRWQAIAEANLIVPGYTATFRVSDWDATRDVPYRVAYDLGEGDENNTFYWTGTVRRDPVDQEVVSVAGFTGNHNTARGVESGSFLWNEHVWFPHTDITRHLEKQNVDLLFFSGDQVYEGASPTFPDRANAELDYLYKWYLWSWAFRDLAKDRPTITIPDDHDVYQGNIWGHGGRPANVDNEGGYVMPAEWVKMIERTQTSHLPDPYDPTPIDQGIGVYYTDMTYGRIGIAIMEDRKFKSGCAGLVPGKEGRPDHFANPDFDPSIVDLPGLKLLGDRQISFLEDWTGDWRGQDMKLAVSQTVFANMATHHGGDLMRLYGDLDSNGWPKRGRDRALRTLRKGFAFMLQGDQHLSTIVHHGIDAPNDAGYSFCVPSIANFYPRAWMPESEGRNRSEGAPANMGEHQDAFGNYVTVYGTTNPTSLTGISTGVEPLELHDKMPGYGVVRFNKTERTITMENWPRYADPEDPGTGIQYPGWPKTIAMEENYGRAATAYLPTIEIAGGTNPVLQVIEEAQGELLYALRIHGTSYQPRVFSGGTYTIRIGNQDQNEMQEFTGIEATTEEQAGTLTVNI